MSAPVSDEAAAFAVTEKRRGNPPPSRTKARYLHWRRLYDANYSISFGDYLRRRLYDDPRYGAP